jgi:hypothetical protein
VCGAEACAGVTAQRQLREHDWRRLANVLEL